MKTEFLEKIFVQTPYIRSLPNTFKIVVYKCNCGSIGLEYVAKEIVKRFAREQEFCALSNQTTLEQINDALFRLRLKG